VKFFLPDQSDTHTTSSAKSAQELFGKNTVDICECIVQNACLKKRMTTDSCVTRQVALLLSVSDSPLC
jgi:hypothetical protein